jgi:hypothetical protein
MKRWKTVPEVTSNVILEHGVDMVRNPASPVTSGDRKRSLSAGADRYDDNAKMLFSYVHSPMSSPVCHVDTDFSSPRPSYGLHTSYPISCLSYSPQKDHEADYDGSSSAGNLLIPIPGMIGRRGRVRRRGLVSQVPAQVLIQVTQSTDNMTSMITRTCKKVVRVAETVIMREIYLFRHMYLH